MSEAFAASYFDSAFYLKNNPDVLAAVERGEFTSAYQHFVAHGQFEKRAPNSTFDAVAYLAENPDVLAAVAQGTIKSAWEHFINHGVKEGRSAGSSDGSFNDAAYLAANPDVAAAVQKGDFASGYAHYLLHGAKEGRPAYGSDGEPVTPAPTFFLTAGKDALVGTNADDIFVAEGYNPNNSRPQTQINVLDSIDGGAGTDTLNITVVGAAANKTLQGTVKNVEIINIDNTAATAAAAHSSGEVDASKLVGATEIWQIGKAADVSKLAVGTTAGFRNITDSNADLEVTVTDDATSATIVFDNVDEGAELDVNGKALASITLSGTRVDGDGDSVMPHMELDIKAGTEVTTLSVNSAIDVELSDVLGNKLVGIDASASTGNIEFGGDTEIATIKTGAGADNVTLTTTTEKDKVAALASTGAGDDKLTVETTGTGTTTVETGAGADTITVVTVGSGDLTVDAGEGDDELNLSLVSHPAGKLLINLGAGDDIFKSDIAIKSTDVIDAGEGNDTLMLKLVGSANVGAFSNFDAFDVAGLNKTLDVSILTSKNEVSEIVGSAAVGASAKLINLGDDVGFRATHHMTTATTLALTQKTAGDLTVTLDADETGSGNVGADAASMAVNATNATALTAVFDADYLAPVDLEPQYNNTSTINLTGVATTLSVVSGGADSSNVLAYTDTGAKLASVTVSGENALNLSFTTATNLESIDASDLSGGLTFSLAQLKDGGALTLGSGVDAITVDLNDTKSIIGLGMADAAAVGSDTDAAEAAQAAVDTLLMTGVSVANVNGAVTDGTIENGVLTFTNDGPATLDDAISIANDAADALNEALLFQYLNDSYIFVQGDTADDAVLMLEGTTGVTHFAEIGTTDKFFIV